MENQEWQNPQTNELNNAGDVVTGTYLGKRESTKYRGDGEPFQEIVYQFIDEDGDEFPIRGTSGINKYMVKIPIGAIVRIEYVKDVPTDKGNPFKMFKVQFKLSGDAELSKTKAQEKRDRAAFALEDAKNKTEWVEGDIVPPEMRLQVTDWIAKNDKKLVIEPSGKIVAVPF